MRPRPSLFVAVAAAALGQRSSATRTGGGLEHLLVQHGSGACARRARTRCALTSWCSGRRWPRLSVDCCVPLLTMSEEETRASARGAFCSLAVYGTLSRPASRNADVAAFGSSAHLAQVHLSLFPRFSCSYSDGDVSGARRGRKRRTWRLSPKRQDSLKGREVGRPRSYVDDDIDDSLEAE